jgi:chromosome partitioning protein
MPPTVAFIGAKGGTLKSACTLSVGADLGRRGLRVALVDCDPQATTTRALPELQADGSEAPLAAVGDPLTAAPVEAALEPVRAAGGALLVYRSGAPFWKARREAVVRHVRRAAEGVDLVLVDTVPVLGDISLAVAAAADLVVIPTAPTADDLDAVDHVIAAIQESVDRAKPIRIVLTKAMAGRRNTRDAVQLLQEKYPDLLYPVVIPHRTTGETANMYLRPAVLYDAVVGDGTLTAAYVALADRIAADVGLETARGRGGRAPSAPARESSRAKRWTRSAP